MTTPTCETCRFCEVSTCRRFPPTVNNNGFCVWPEVRTASDWCGEWQARAETSTKIGSEILAARKKLLHLLHRYPDYPHPEYVLYLSREARKQVSPGVCDDGTEMLLGMRVRDCEAGWAVVREDA